MAKGIKERLEAACAEAGLDRAIKRKILESVLGTTVPDEAELAAIRAEIARMAAVEQEMKDLLGVTSREAIVPALEAILERRKTLKTAAGFDGLPDALSGSS